MSGSANNIGTTQVLVQADTKSADVSIKSTSEEFAKLGTAAEKAAAKIEEAGAVVDRTAKLQQQQVERWRASFEREAQQRQSTLDLIRTNGEAGRAALLASLQANILARSATNAAGAEMELAVASDAAAGSGMRLQTSLGLVDNAMRGQTSRALADIIRGMSGVAFVMDALPWAAAAAGIYLLGKVAIEGAEKLLGVGSAAEEAREKVQESWNQILGSVQGVNDELTVSNARMGDSIAELEKTPSDGLKTALLEAADAAKKLGDKLDEDLGKVQKLIEANRVGALQQMLHDSFSGPTDEDRGDVNRTIGFAVGRYQKIAPDYQDVMQRSAKAGNWSNYMDARKDEIAALHAALDPQIHTLEDYLAKNQLMAGDKESPAHREAVQGYQLLTGILSDLESQAVSERQEHEKRTLQDTQATARAASGSQQEAERQRFLVGTLDPRFKAMREVEQSMPGSASSDRARAETSMRMNLEDKAPGGNAAMEMTEDLTRSGPRWKQYNEEIARGMLAQEKYRESLLLATVKMGAETGALSKLQAIQEEAAIAHRAYLDEVAEIRRQMADVASDGSLTDVQRATQTQQLKNRVQELGDQDALAQYEAQLQRQMLSPMGELHDKILQTADDFTNLGHILSENFTGALNSFNATLMKVLSTPASQLRGQHPWRNMAAGMAEHAGTSALQYGEGTLMKLLTGKNPKAKLGTKDNPMYVRNADGGKGSGAPGSGGLLGMLNDSDTAGKLFGGRLFGPGGIFDPGSDSGIASAGLGGGGDWLSGGESLGIPAGMGASVWGAGLAGFANGGKIRSNLPVLVGEHGPEILAGAGGRNVIPNHKIGSSTTIVHIDARGATDPAATEAAAHRAMRAYYPAFKQGTIAAMKDDARRRPASMQFR